MLLVTVPVVFIHYGNHNYFQSVVSQAKRVSSNVLVVGNETTPMRTHIQQNGAAQEFSSLYQHLSTNGHQVELFCFSRWFYLRELMTMLDIEVCLYLDSDVLLYKSPDEGWNQFNQFDFTLCHRVSGHTSFWTRKGIDGFCGFLLKTYADKTGYDFEKIASHYHVRQKHGLPGGVCDMTLLEYYSYKVCGSVGEMMHINDGSVYDHNINVSDQGFDMSGSHKDITEIGGKPWGHLGDKLIKFNSIHCQGPAKSLIPQYAGFNND